jgi:hypothetical protein
VTTMLLHTETAAHDDTASRTGTCQAFAGSLVAPCPNAATDTTVVRGEGRRVCPAHAPFRFPHQRG